ncbi:MAG: ATP-binding cassette domain-containing protein [Nitriliruptorales bacterium]|nr:ATP-binding cassette domain-containing protein [Nitriliruptorales bacterium]
MISVRGVRKHFPIKEGVLQRVTGHVRAVDDVSFDVPRGKTVGLVGESGCGKSTLGRVISGLTDATEGGVYFRLSHAAKDRLDELLAIPEAERSAAEGRELAEIDRAHRIDALGKDRWREYRRNCQVVFQDAFASLNPRHLVKDIIGRPLRIHHEASGTQLTERIVDLLESVGLGSQHLYRFPHQFSGGQRQRISIARAVALDPEFIVLDEPTSALDVSVQAQILNLLHDLQEQRGLTYLFISHDLNVVEHMSDRIIVMYLGQIAETGPSEQIFAAARHPYTEALLEANPAVEGGARAVTRLKGSVPDPARPPQGCRFHTRCPVVTSQCGWEVDDAVTEAELRDSGLDGLSGVSRQSAFSADLTFETEAQAAAFVAQLQAQETPEPLAAALTELRQTGTDVSVRFQPVVPVRLERVGPDQLSACLLHTGQQPAAEAVAR